ncbi:MAG: hypothetical protein EP149_09835 [Phascolarctobacterium sp.]|nr:hypothetical protein [Phascolarctobacterium sp.]
MKKSKVGYLIIAFLSAWVLAQFFSCLLPVQPQKYPTADDITNTISGTQDHNQRAGELTGAAGSEIKAAGTDITRAVENVERAESIANQNAGTLEECRNIVSTIKTRTREAKSILADVERSAKEAE